MKSTSIQNLYIIIVYQIFRPKKLNVLSPKEVKRFKILVLGDAGVGKTSILEKYINNSFD